MIAVGRNWISLVFLCALSASARGQVLTDVEINRQSNQAVALQKQGRYAEGIAIYERILPSVERVYGANGENTATILNNLASLYDDMGLFAKAEPLYLRTLEIRRSRLGDKHLDLANPLNNLAFLYQNMGQYSKAELLFRQSLDIRQTLLGKDDPIVAQALNNLAGLLKAKGELTNAEQFYTRSLEIREQKLGPNHLLIASTLNNLGVLYAVMGQYAKAESLHRRSLQIRQANLGADHPNVATAYNNLAILFKETAQYDKAEPLYVRALQIREAKLGMDHPDVAQSLNNLAALYKAMGQDQKVEPLYMRALEIREAKLGKDHPEVASSLYNLAHFYTATNRHAKAEPLLARSLEIRRAKLGSDHPEVALTLHHRAWNFGGLSKWTEAIAHVQQARQATASYLANLLPLLTEKEQITLLRTKVQRDFYKALSLGGNAAPKEAASASAEWLLNGKAMAHQALAEQTMLARDAAHPEARALSDALLQTRAMLAAHINRSPRTGFETDYQQEMKNLKAREQDLSQKLARAVGRSDPSSSWLTLGELRAKLSKKSVFIDIARFPVFDFAAHKFGAPHYVAWIVAASGDVRSVDLGDAESIDRSVDELRRALISTAKSITMVGEAEATEALRKPLERLSAKILHPFLPALDAYEEWIVCPDGALWLVPWNALLLPTGEFAVEKKWIRHVVSGRDLVLTHPRANAESASLFADPDYDLAPDKVARPEAGPPAAAKLFGGRWRGVIGNWNVSLEFHPSEAIIYDDDDRGTVAGKGTWSIEGNALTIRTGISLFQGMIQGSEWKGLRSRTDANGTVVRDAFRFTRLTQGTTATAASRTIPRVARLPGTALEAEAILPHVRKWLGAEPRMLAEADASEPMVKAVKSPRVLVVATHGYFLPEQRIQTKSGSEELDPSSAPVSDSDGATLENPFLRCGLLLAGCNKRGDAKPGEDDGVLTGLEIVGMDLRGTELVVLSACETGLGDVRSGEGVAGLRQAFQLAGAKAVLASLWQVPDRETALLMKAFYGELANGERQSVALREAQRSRIASRRAAFGAAHPFYWAAFTFTGKESD